MNERGGPVTDESIFDAIKRGQGQLARHRREELARWLDSDVGEDPGEDDEDGHRPWCNRTPTSTQGCSCGAS